MGRLYQQPVGNVSTSKDPVSFHLRLQLGGNCWHQGMNSVQFLRLALDTASGSSHENLKRFKSENEALLNVVGTKFEVLAKKCAIGVMSRTPLAKSSFGESMTAA